MEKLLTITNVVFIALMLIPFLKKNNFNINSAANFIQTLGVLGTFFGIFLGLWEFKPEDIKSSVPKLLEGLQTAFFTSIVGIGLATLIKHNFFGFVASPFSDAETPSGENNEVKELIACLKSIEKSIVGDGENTLNTQLLKIRTSNNENFQKFHRLFQEFADKMVADSTQSLIDALTQVMKDFNTKINEQFGENFKQLNQGIGTMLQWQQNYKTQIEQISAQFALATTSIMQCEQAILASKSSLEGIASHTQIYRSSAEKLDAVLKNLNTNLHAIENMAKDADKVFPSIKEQLAKLTTNLEEDAKKRLEQIDNMLGQELEKSLKSLGDQLASLSEKFVKDYTPLTDKLRSVVEMAKKLETQY
jgi:chromosome segregation ATPase